MAETTQRFNPNNQDHLVTLSGKKYITFVGLQARLTDQGKTIVGTYSELLQVPDEDNGNVAIVRVSVEILGKDGVSRYFANIGDASPDSVGNKKLAPHVIRMAETRSMARSLRVASRSEWTALDELAADDSKVA